MDEPTVVHFVERFMAENIGAFTAAAVGAFLGSGSAFVLESSRRKRERKDREHDAALTAQYALQAQWNTLENIRQQFLEPFRKEPDRHMKLTVFSLPEARLSIPFDKLIFVAKRDDPDLLQTIRIAEDGYIAAMDALLQRNEKMEAFYYDPEVKRQQFDEETGRSVLSAPIHKVFLIKKLTDALYQRVDSALPRLDAAFIAMRSCIKRNFPRRFRALGVAAKS